MNCEIIQQEILLSQAGELPERKLDELRKHLVSCESCRKYGEMTGEIISMARTSLSSEGPDSRVIASILAAARAESERKVLFFSLPSLRWAACAAAALIVCGAWLWAFRGQSGSSASQMSALAIAVGSEENLRVISYSGKTEKDQELHALASHLLIMEGFAVDEAHEVEAIDVVDEPRPTALQSRNIAEFVLQRCV